MQVYDDDKENQDSLTKAGLGDSNDPAPGNEESQMQNEGKDSYKESGQESDENPVLKDSDDEPRDDDSGLNNPG